MLYPGSVATGVVAGTISIDIHFGTLSRTAILPEVAIDRQIAANLYLKNILDEYLALKKRNDLLLEDLSIPGINPKQVHEDSSPDPVPETVREEKEARKNIRDFIVFSQTSQTDSENSQDFALRDTGVPGQNRQQSTRANNNPEHQRSLQSSGKNVYQTTYGSNAELPWIFSFVLKLIQYVADNKIGIILWVAVLSICGLLGTVVVKR